MVFVRDQVFYLLAISPIYQFFFGSLAENWFSHNLIQCKTKYQTTLTIFKRPCRLPFGTHNTPNTPPLSVKWYFPVVVQRKLSNTLPINHFVQIVYLHTWIRLVCPVYRQHWWTLARTTKHDLQQRIRRGRICKRNEAARCKRHPNNWNQWTSSIPPNSWTKYMQLAN